MIVYVKKKKTQGIYKKTPRISEFSQVTRYYLNIQLFYWEINGTSTEHMDTKILNTKSFTIAWKINS